MISTCVQLSVLLFALGIAHARPQGESLSPGQISVFSILCEAGASEDICSMFTTNQPVQGSTVAIIDGSTTSIALSGLTTVASDGGSYTAYLSPAAGSTRTITVSEVSSTLVGGTSVGGSTESTNTADPAKCNSCTSTLAASSCGNDVGCWVTGCEANEDCKSCALTCPLIAALWAPRPDPTESETNPDTSPPPPPPVRPYPSCGDDDLDCCKECASLLGAGTNEYETCQTDACMLCGTNPQCTT